MNKKEQSYNPQKSGQTLGRNEQQKMGQNQAHPDSQRKNSSKIGRKPGNPT
ncbi:hypothetical protein [Legionella clemsonensis]|uniref:Uncharacterized protein n=1 Tax=Legionella clemsonensis TaxID=1867846 RepID=A0A222P506_9GAMM|nr:hypothetical protein [Legionella clemsonensis]ASQ46903.1 hypothetical protein clem_11830 [Legionella clemsonensis]